MGLENLKNLSPKLFNDRIKKFNNTPQHAPDGKRVLTPGIQHQSEHTMLDDLQYEESVFGRTFKPFFNRLGPTLYTPELPGWPVLLGMGNKKLENIYFKDPTAIGSPMFQQVDSEIGEDPYGVGVRDSDSPMSNTEDSTSADNPILDGSPDIDGASLLNNYSRYGMISIEHNPFVSGGGEPNYESLNYGFNSYKGSLLDNGIGGIFNQSINHSSVFREIYTPLGYGESPVGNDVLGRGNMAPIDGSPPGSGYQDRLDLLNTYKGTRETGTPPPYIDSTSSEEGSISLSSFYYYGGQPTNYIPFLNRFVDSSTDGRGNYVFGGSEPTEKRKVPLNYDITGQTISSMDQHTLLFGNKFDQTVTDNKTVGVGGSAKLNLSTAAYNSGFRQSIFTAPTNGSNLGLFFGGNNPTGGEPYMIHSNDPDELSMITFGRELPWNQMARDVGRITKFMGSSAGLLFIGRQNLLGLTARSNPTVQPNVTFHHPSKRLTNFGELGGSSIAKFLPLPQKFRGFYNPVSTLAQIVTSGAIGVGGSSVGHIPRDWPFMPSWGLSRSNENYWEYMKDPMTKLWEDRLWYRDQLSNTAANRKINVSSINSVRTSMDPKTSRGMLKGFGDFMTLMELNKASENRERISQAYPGDSKDIDGSDHGMPFYFYDMRTNQYLIFRGYIEGLTENIAPQWNSDRYVGRSEPVYSYVGAERDISFSLKFFAQTRFELNAIYMKLNKLTSMCYPQYKDDEKFAGGLTRMKPPLIKMRMGELYGSSTGKTFKETSLGNKDVGKDNIIENKDLMGFIKSISYTVPDESPWEIARGKRVPKYITSAMTFQVIHDSVPGHDTQYYGFTGYQKGDKGYWKGSGGLEPNPFIEDW